MKHYHYMSPFNSRVFGAAEKRADRYWKKRKEMQAMDNCPRNGDCVFHRRTYNGSEYCEWSRDSCPYILLLTEPAELRADEMVKYRRTLWLMVAGLKNRPMLNFSEEMVLSSLKEKLKKALQMTERR